MGVFRIILYQEYVSMDAELNIKHHFSSGLYAKEMQLPKAYFALSHKHTYDHVSMLFKGSAIVEVGGEETIYNAPAFILIKANQEHKITAIDDVVWFCVHETEEKDVNKIDEVAISK